MSYVLCFRNVILIWRSVVFCLTLALLRIGIAFKNSVDPDQMASKVAIWSGSTLFVIQFVNLYEQTTLSYPIGWPSEMGVTNLIYSAG